METDDHPPSTTPARPHVDANADNTATTDNKDTTMSTNPAPATLEDVVGTSLQRYVSATIGDVNDAFGPPHRMDLGGGPDDLDSTVEWALATPHGTATVYDHICDDPWRPGSPDEPIRWHLAAHNAEAAEWVAQQIEAAVAKWEAQQ